MPEKRSSPDMAAGDRAGAKPQSLAEKARYVNVHIAVSEPFGVVALFVIALCLIWLLYRQMERNRA
jgi:hypothetical protein